MRRQMFLSLKTKTAIAYLRKAMELVDRSVMEPPEMGWKAYDVYPAHPKHDDFIQEAAIMCSEARKAEATAKHILSGGYKKE